MARLVALVSATAAVEPALWLLRSFRAMKIVLFERKSRVYERWAFG
jgi:hypothetical protein